MAKVIIAAWRYSALGVNSLFVVCPLLFLAGFVDSIAGGGGLISLPAFLLAGLSPHVALSSNKFSSTIGTTASVWRFSHMGYIRKQFLLFVPFALLGSALGTKISLWIDEQYFQWVLLLLLPLTTFLIMRKRSFEQAELRLGQELSKRSYALGIVAAFLVGAYDGFYGPGTGTFLIILLTSMANFDLPSALGAGKLINYSSNIASLALGLWHGKVLFPLAIYAALANLLGQMLGSRLVSRQGAKIVRPLIICVLTLLFGKIIFDLLQR